MANLDHLNHFKNPEEAVELKNKLPQEEITPEEFEIQAKELGQWLEEEAITFKSQTQEELGKIENFGHLTKEEIEEIKAETDTSQKLDQLDQEVDQISSVVTSKNKPEKSNKLVQRLKMAFLATLLFGVAAEGMSQKNKKKVEKKQPVIEKNQEKLPPYVTYDPEDIRIQLYKDSLRLHQEGDSLWKSFGKTPRYGIDIPKLSEEELSKRSMAYSVSHHPMAAGYFRDNKKDVDRNRTYSSRIYYYYNAPKQEVVYDRNYPKESIYDYKKVYAAEIRAPYSYFANYYTSDKFKDRLSNAGMQYSNDLAVRVHTILNESPHLVFTQSDSTTAFYPDSVQKENYFAREYTVDSKFIFDKKDKDASNIPNDVYTANCISHKIMSRNKEFAKGFNEKNLKQELERETNVLKYISRFAYYDENTMHIGPVGFEKSRREQQEKVRSLEQTLKHIQPSPIQDLIDKNVEIANKYQKKDPYAFIADINTLRYELYKLKLYDSHTEDFSLETIKKISKDETVKILLKKLIKSAGSKKDLVKAMNEII
jgi:hypothetical protein